MAVHRYRGLLIAYRFWPLPMITPRWFDDNTWAMWRRHPSRARLLFGVWASMRSHGLIRLSYYGRA